MAENKKQSVLSLLSQFKGLDPLKQLLWSELGYDRADSPLSRRKLGEPLAQTLADDPLLFATAPGDDQFHVLYTRLAGDRLLLGAERALVGRLLREHPYGLFVFSNENQDRWHFLNVKEGPDAAKRRLFRRITIGADERLRTASERIAMLDMEGREAQSALAVQQLHDQAFDVEAVTRDFFKEYQAVFELLRKPLQKQTKDGRWAHDYALQFLNRIMFIYFIQRKGWLAGEREFFRAFWEAYQKGGGRDAFFDQWLKILFFEAFNNEKGLLNTPKRSYLPQPIREALWKAPYLNGGLFERKVDLDERHPFTLPDALCRQVFEFFERFNFTIAEDSPLDQEVAVDPEMIGKVYEMLVNVSEEIDEKGDAGIFYTPRIEIDLMCRLSLVQYLANHLGEKHKALFHELVFAMEEDEKKAADEKVRKTGLWAAIVDLLRKLTVLDPACGSGSFLVGMLAVLDDLLGRGEARLGRGRSAYERRKAIVAQSLYGVDIMEWACHTAELRLWLALIIEADFSPAELQVRREPLLPNFSFKIRCGDSLVQELGGINFGLHHSHLGIEASLRSKLDKFKEKKLAFFNGKVKGALLGELRLEERRLFDDLLFAEEHALDNKIKQLSNQIEYPERHKQGGMFDLKPNGQQLPMDVEKWKRDRDDKRVRLQQVRAARKALAAAKEVPFIWDMAFAEIFEEPPGAFGIVVGNPPYVRQEAIAAPLVGGVLVTKDKKEYKGKLARSVYRAFPHFFQYKEAGDTAARKLDAKSDLYIYFFFHGLSLLEPKGAFCFITSNSWLDVGYGKDLQEFLLRNCPVHLIVDNQVKRSFADADVNTVIALFSAPVEDPAKPPFDHTARFVMFTVPFEQVLHPVIFQEIEEARERKKSGEYRLHPARQEDLLRDGMADAGAEDADSDDVGATRRVAQSDQRASQRLAPTKAGGPLIKSAKYIGNKWGGKYLRAPDIYWTILEKGKGKLVRLGDVAKVRFGIKTGANEFFYLDKEQIREWGIEDEFLAPVLRRPRECERILLSPSDFQYKVFLCPREKSALKGTSALEYIKFGERNKHHELPTCAARRYWYNLGNPRPIHIAAKMTTKYRHYFPVSRKSILVDNRFYEMSPKNSTVEQLAASLNASIVPIWLENSGRTYGGGGGPLDIKVYELKDAMMLNPALVDQKFDFWKQAILRRPVLHIWKEIELSDRKEYDEQFFDILGLTKGERDAVYEALISLVRKRLEKAKSM